MSKTHDQNSAELPNPRPALARDAHTGYVTAFALLVACLKETGALRPGEFEESIRITLESLEHMKGHAGYAALEHILDSLDRVEEVASAAPDQSNRVGD